MSRASRSESATPRQTPPFACGGWLLLIALLLWLATWPLAAVANPLLLAAASLLIATAGLCSAGLFLQSRQQDQQPGESIRRKEKSEARGPRAKVAQRVEELLSRPAHWERESEWSAIGATAALSVFAVVCLNKGWHSGGLLPSTQLDAYLVGIAFAAAFPLLVLERHFAAIPVQRFTEAPMVARLCRVPLFTFLAVGGTLVLRWLEFNSYVPLIERAIAVVIGLVATELLARSLFRAFMPAASAAERHSPADSAVAGLLQLEWPSSHRLSEAMSRHFGIDLSRSWALGYLRRATLPALVALAVASWLLTGISSLSLSERAVYEVLGRPAGVLHSGLNLHLPWPVGILRKVEYGRVREIPIVFAPVEGETTQEQSPQPSAPGGIEGVPPPAADRLWDASHPSEASYLVASKSNGRQNFEVINIDLRIMYRIGLSDDAARHAAYDIASPEAIIQAAAGRMLARYFARYTLFDVLGQNREGFIRGFQQELQTRLTDLGTGIDVMGVVIEAIHPPPAAAPSYQGVQTAAIKSVVQIAVAQADAARTVNDAQAEATKMRNAALAAAAERISQAKAELALFSGDRQAHQVGGPAFLLERRLQHFDKAVAGIPFTVVDHRINRDNAPTLDLRPPSYFMDSTVPEEGR